MILRFLIFMFVSIAANAQAPYPNRPIKFVMAYPPAGSSDVLARPIANEMTKGLGQPVLLEYKPGAGSTIGADFTAKSPPDGYTIVLLLTAHAINASLMQKLPYDTVKDFTPITLAAVAPLVVEVHAQSPIRTLRDLIDAAKSNKGKLNYASAGAGNTSHLAVELFKLTVGVDMTHVPYKGSGPAITGDPRARSRPDVRRHRLVAGADPGRQIPRHRGDDRGARRRAAASADRRSNPACRASTSRCGTASSPPPARRSRSCRS